MRLLFQLLFLILVAIIKVESFAPVFDQRAVVVSKGGRQHTGSMSAASQSDHTSGSTDRHVETVLFIECGFGNDSHGQSATKAAVRACRNSIEFNSIPSVGLLVPGGYDGLKLDVILAVPPKYQATLDLEKVREVFPYGEVKFTVQDGGMVAPSGIAIDSLGDKNDDMVVVCAAVTVGY